MHIYALTEANQNIQPLLERAKQEGGIQISGQDGEIFMITPIDTGKSPLDIAGVTLDLTAEEIVGFVREGRERS